MSEQLRLLRNRAILMCVSLLMNLMMLWMSTGGTIGAGYLIYAFEHEVDTSDGWSILFHFLLAFGGAIVFLPLLAISIILLILVVRKVKTLIMTVRLRKNVEVSLEQLSKYIRYTNILGILDIVLSVSLVLIFLVILPTPLCIVFILYSILVFLDRRYFKLIERVLITCKTEINSEATIDND